MGVGRSSGQTWTRRTFLGALPFASVAGARPGQEFPAEKFVYADRATEFAVTRFTSPNYDSRLPGYANRFISRKFRYLLYSSDRTGTTQAYELDLEKGVSRLVTAAAELAPWSLYLLPDQRHFLYVDGRRLMRGAVRRPGAHRLYEVPDGFRFERGLSVTDDGRTVAFIETNGRIWRVRLLDLRRRRTATILNEAEPVTDVQIRPRRRTLLYQEAGGWWTADFHGRRLRRLELAPGRPVFAVWSRTGASVLYLSIPERKGKLNTLREYFADTRQDRLIAKTTQFVAFGANANSSVFVGASGARATPYVFLLLRVGGRELTLCEHRASQPARVQPVFSPDSRWIYFQSDRDGRSCLYGVRVEGLVESTD